MEDSIYNQLKRESLSQELQLPSPQPKLSSSSPRPKLSSTPQPKLSSTPPLPPIPTWPPRFTLQELRNFDNQVMALLNTIDPLRVAIDRVCMSDGRVIDVGQTNSNMKGNEISYILSPHNFSFDSPEIACYYAQILAGTLYTRALCMNISPTNVRIYLEKHYEKVGGVEKVEDEDEKGGVKVGKAEIENENKGKVGDVDGWGEVERLFGRQLVESLGARVELGSY